MMGSQKAPFPPFLDVLDLAGPLAQIPQVTGVLQAEVAGVISGNVFQSGNVRD